MASLKDWLRSVADKQTQRALSTLLDAVRLELAALKGTSIIAATTLSTGSTPANVATTAFSYRIAGMPYAKAAVAAGTALGITDTINTAAAAGTFYGGFVAQINAAGTISFKSVAANQVYTSAAAAEVAARAITPTAANVIIGYIVVQSLADTAWVAGTSTFTLVTGCTSVSYYSAAVTSLLTE